MPSRLFTLHHKQDWTEYPDPSHLADPTQHYFDEQQIHLFRYNQRRSETHRAYTEDRNIIIHSRFEPSAQIVTCYKGSPCRQRFFCHRCSNYDAHRVRIATAHIPVETLYHLTISHRKPISLASDRYIHLQFFKAYRNKLKALRKDGLISMYIASQEIAIRQLYPSLGVNPHVHVVVQTNRLNECISRLQKSNLSIEEHPIADDDSFGRTIGYFYKPINLAVPYSLDWHKHPVQVNRNISRFLTEFAMLKMNRHQTYRNIEAFGGVLHQV